MSYEGVIWVVVRGIMRELCSTKVIGVIYERSSQNFRFITRPEFTNQCIYNILW